MTLRQHLRLALDGAHPTLGRAVELALIAVIVVSVIAMGIETLNGLPGWAQTVLWLLEICVVTLFALEYVLRVWVTDRPLRYVFSFYGIVDLVSFAPTLVSLLLTGTSLDGRAFRSLRLFRLLRLLKIARYTHAAERLRDAWQMVREEVIVFGLAALVVLYVCALIIYQFENEAQPEAFSSVFSAMWWAAVTLTTVGYGDIYPVTAMGRIFTVFMLFVALGIIAVPTGLVASAMSEMRRRKREEADGGAEREQHKSRE
jgi:voltage-gated potassium channel